MDEIPAGIWHLKVDAKDDEGIILYTGEIEVEIFAGFVTQVNLTLYPTGEGTGSIYIYVTWGIHINSNWIDFISNPVLISSNNYYDQRGIAQPEIIYENNHFKMWYYGEEGAGVKYVLYAESNDGISWDKPINEPVLSPGHQGSWDSWAVHPGAILKDGGIYKMYYSGWAETYGQWDIGLATSIDGINWEKFPQPILYGTSGWEFQIGASSIIKYNEVYYLYYYGRNLPNYNIGLATSTDGLHWERFSGNPILTNTESWEANGVYYATVVREDNQFKMIYMNSSGTGFGFAYSSDGMNWTKDIS
ncbi:MAG: hypothetical protein IH819_11685, partial [Bacteroidetes bacterium]|nr:hypothetical protein [Bacteroidota bacterium]